MVFFASGRSHPVSTLEILSMAIEALWSNKLRTGLTMLGVIIGIASVIAITSVGQGVQKGVEQQIQALGTNVLQVFAGAARTGNVRQGIGSITTLTWEDSQAIQEQAPSARVVSAYLQGTAQVVYGGQNTSTTIIGTDANYPETRDIHPQAGRFFNQEELDSAKQVAVLGSTLRNTLFGTVGNAVGESIRIQGEGYQVIGVVEPKGSQGASDRDDQVYIPLTIMSSRIVGNKALTGVAVDGIVVKTSNTEQLDAAQFQVRVFHKTIDPAILER